MKINLYGDIFGQTGYNRHTRSLANALFELGFDVRLDTAKPPQWERECNDAEFNMCTKEFDPDCITIMIAQPQYWNIALAAKPKKFYGFCVWEGDVVPEYWVKFLTDRRVDGIFVPSQHTKDAILKVYKQLSKKIHIIPHGYNPAIFYPEEKPTSKVLTFSANKGWSQGLYDRGGLQWLIKAFSQEFNNKDKVELKIKINPVYNNPEWNIKKEISALKLDRINKAKIYTTCNLISDDALRHFYNEGDVFVTTSMGDAFNLPVIEAMACGLPVCATYFGGQSDMVDNKNGWVIKQGKLVHWSKEPAYEETKWFKPNISGIRKKLRYIYDHQEQIKKKREKVLSEAPNWTWLQTAKKIKKLLSNLN